jgi:ribonuclease D
VALDLETTGLNPREDKVRLVSVSTTAGTRLVDCFAVDPSPLLPALAEKRLVFHNAAFDLGFLARMGFELGEGKVMDTMLMSQMTEGETTTENKEAL